MHSLLFDHITQIYRPTPRTKVMAIVDFCLKVNPGEAVALMGPSGSGKSTVLRLVAGLEKITQGRLYFGEECVNDLPPKERDLSFVFQNYALYPELTVAQNLAIGMSLRKISKSEIKARILEVLPLLGLMPDVLKRLPHSLSGGQRQRVAIGRAIMRRPKIMLCDEPLSNLDVSTRDALLAVIGQLQREWGMTMLYVTHDLHEAQSVAQRIVLMKEGRIESINLVIKSEGIN